MSDDNYGTWIDWEGGECPIPDAKAGDWLYRLRLGQELAGNNALNHSWSHFGDRDDIIAYRVRIPADDLLRQAIEALRPFATDELMEGLDDGPDEKSTSWPTFRLGDFRKARAVLTAYDKREQS